MIVLTGSIATGKSSVCRQLEKNGYAIIDADKIAKELIDAKVIEKLFGSNFIKNGRVDRKILGDLVFNNPKQREKLNRYIHPLIRKKIYQEVKKMEESGRKYIVDIPLYFESKHYDGSIVGVVYCPKEKQIGRLMRRDGISKEGAIKRVASQIDIEEKKGKADFVIDNSQDEKHLKVESKKFMEYLSDNFKV
jgi:dephospho-CoA kinase